MLLLKKKMSQWLQRYIFLSIHYGSVGENFIFNWESILKLPVFLDIVSPMCALGTIYYL